MPQVGSSLMVINYAPRFVNYALGVISYAPREHLVWAIGYVSPTCFFYPCCLYYKNITIVNDTSIVIIDWCHKLEHHLWSSITLLNSSIMLLELSVMLLESFIVWAIGYVSLTIYLLDLLLQWNVLSSKLIVCL